MSEVAQQSGGWRQSPIVRKALVVAGFLLMIGAVLVGPLPGPGFIILFPAGLALILQNSQWAKRLYVRFKRRHPNKGRWTDWGMRRASAKRREELSKAELAEAQAGDQQLAND